MSFYAQSNEKPQRLKYVTTAPDGSVAMTVIDDSRDNTLKLESANSFYKYQLINTETGEPVFSSANRGFKCTIDKSKIAEGTYNLRIFTKNFIITSEITLTPKIPVNKDNSIAMNE